MDLLDVQVYHPASRTNALGSPRKVDEVDFAEGTRANSGVGVMLELKNLGRPPLSAPHLEGQLMLDADGRRATRDA